MFRARPARTSASAITRPALKFENSQLSGTTQARSGSPSMACRRLRSFGVEYWTDRRVAEQQIDVGRLQLRVFQRVQRRRHHDGHEIFARGQDRAGLVSLERIARGRHVRLEPVEDGIVVRAPGSAAPNNRAR